MSDVKQYTVIWHCLLVSRAETHGKWHADAQGLSLEQYFNQHNCSLTSLRAGSPTTAHGHVGDINKKSSKPSVSAKTAKVGQLLIPTWHTHVIVLANILHVQQSVTCLPHANDSRSCIALESTCMEPSSPTCGALVNRPYMTKLYR